MITKQTIAEAEQLLGITYTDQERALVVEAIGPQIELAAARRARAFPQTLSPASRFEPRLPGWSMPEVGPFIEPPIEDTPLPDDDAAIAFAPVTVLAGWLKRRALTAVRLTEIYLERIDRLDRSVFSIVNLNPHALDEARLADRMIEDGQYLGPLHGIPWGAKDLLDTAGIETAWGAEPYRGRVPAEDCTIARKLKDAGAILLAKTAVGALAFGDVWYGGRCRNPWNTDEGSSGSSAGSAAALAAGFMAFTIGTETLGSLIAPAARCGTATIRPTFGRVSRAGIMPLAWSLDKAGPMCRTIDDLALVLRAIDGFDERDPGSIAAPLGYDPDRAVRGMRVGYFPADFDAASALDQQALAAVGALGVELVPLTRPDLPYMSLRSMMFAEAAAAFEELTLSGRDEMLTRQDVDAWPNEFRKAWFLSAVDYVQLDRLRREVMVAMDPLFGEVDAIVAPPVAQPFLSIVNFTGHPGTAVRTGFGPMAARDGKGQPAANGTVREVPHAITICGRLFDEGTILALARALERKRAIWDRRPDGF